MSSQPPVELILEGNVPSKKNSRVHTRAGVSLPNKAFYDWQRSALWQVKVQTRAHFLNPVAVEVIVYFGTNIRADLDNRLTSLLDMLVEAMVLADDKWQNVPMLQAQAEYRKGRPGAFVRITEV
jgi:Holliday junction resolvase RusA-like endonuclease